MRGKWEVSTNGQILSPRSRRNICLHFILVLDSRNINVPNRISTTIAILPPFVLLAKCCVYFNHTSPPTAFPSPKFLRHHFLIVTVHFWTEKKLIKIGAWLYQFWMIGSADLWLLLYDATYFILNCFIVEKQSNRWMHFGWNFFP